MKTLKKLFILMLVFKLTLAGQANALEASADNEEILLRLKVGMITEAEFPEKIANVTKSVSSETLQIEILENRMFLLPRENFDSKIYVVTRDNISYCLHLIMDETQAPTRIKIEKPKQAMNEEQSKETANTVELMKTLLLGKLPPGAVSSKPRQEEIFNNGKFRMVINEAYEFPNNVKAFILTFENLTPKPVVIPIEHIELPGLLAISVESQILEARPAVPDKKKNSAYTAKAYLIVQGLNQ